MSVCDDSAVHLQCDGEDRLRLTVTWRVDLSDLPTSDLPHLYDVGETNTPEAPPTRPFSDPCWVGLLLKVAHYVTAVLALAPLDPPGAALCRLITGECNCA